jgi:hypothetical protein
MDLLSTAAIGKFLVSSGGNWAKGEVLKRLRENPIDRAIRETDEAVPDLSGVAEGLRAWPARSWSSV